MNSLTKTIITIVSLFVAGDATAEIQLATIFGDHIVLQQQKAVPVWGKADPGAKVTVEFAGQQKTATSDKDGKWMVKLDPMKASAEGRVLKAGTIEIKNVLVGEVWFCSGQSNMAWALHQIGKVMEADDPLLRLAKPHSKGTRWSPARAGDSKFSAVAYYTGCELRRELRVPVAVVDASVGGSKIEQWIPVSDYEQLAVDVPAVGEQYKVLRESARRKNRPTGIGSLFATRMQFVPPMAVRGWLWYQGEFNCMDRELYAPKQGKLIEVWRREWGEPLPFYFVQLPGHGRIYRGHFPGLSDDRIRLCEAQAATLTVPNTGMVVTIDIGDKGNNHPPNKLDVGRRLARLLLAKSYGRKNLVPTGPLYRSHERRDGKFIIHFDHVGPGLMVGRKPMAEGKVTTDPVEEEKNGKLAHFAICGEDRIWHWADATINGDTVAVWSPSVHKPVAVRYAFSTWPEGANLYNRDGLPAAPFRTDDWGRKEERRNPPKQ